MPILKKRKLPVAVRSSISAALIFLAACAGQVGSPQEALPSGSVFHSRRGNFTCVVPDLVRPGARQVETYEGDNTFVSFMDDMGTLLRIESSPVEPEDRARFYATPPDEMMSELFDKSLMPREFLRASSETTVVHRENIDTAGGRAFFAVVDIPRGSNLYVVDPNGNRRRQASVRGVLVFANHYNIYIISNQEFPAYLDMNPNATIEERSERLKDNLLQTVASMTFN